MGRSPCCSKEGLNRGTWTSSEDKILSEYILAHGEGRWRSLPQRAGLKRCGKSCRLRWLNYLRPDIKRGNISEDEEDLIIRLHKLLGNRWSLIAGRLPGRTDNEIKNYWNTTISKKSNQRINNSIASSTKKWKNNKSSSMKKKEVAEAQSPPYSSGISVPVHHHDENETCNTNNGTGSCSSRVIRTKATRCTKVLIPPHLQTSPQPPGIMSTPAAAATSPSPSSPPFWEDFKFDDKFFSDFLNNDDDGGHNINKEFAFIDDLIRTQSGSTNESDIAFFSALSNVHSPGLIVETFLDPALLEQLD